MERRPRGNKKGRGDIYTAEELPQRLRPNHRNICIMKLQYNGIQRDVGAVLFDMDGVVTDTMPWHFKCWGGNFL